MPDGYFDDFTARMMDHLPAADNGQTAVICDIKPSFWRRYRKVVATAAASVCIGLVGLGAYLHHETSDTGEKHVAEAEVPVTSSYSSADALATTLCSTQTTCTHTWPTLSNIRQEVKMKQIVRRLVFIMVVALVALQTQAQERPKKFDPARFEADLEQFITTEAGLNPYQAAKFFPLYREMQRSNACCSTRCAITSMSIRATISGRKSHQGVRPRRLGDEGAATGIPQEVLQGIASRCCAQDYTSR